MGDQQPALAVAARTGIWKGDVLCAVAWMAAVAVWLSEQGLLPALLAGALVGAGAHLLQVQVRRRRIASCAARGDKVEARAAIRLSAPGGNWSDWRHGYLTPEESQLLWRPRRGGETITLQSLDRTTSRHPTAAEYLRFDVGTTVVGARSVGGQVELAMASYVLAGLGTEA